MQNQRQPAASNRPSTHPEMKMDADLEIWTLKNWTDKQEEVFQRLVSVKRLLVSPIISHPIFDPPFPQHNKYRLVIEWRLK
jgi:hypothetical protein